MKLSTATIRKDDAIPARAVRGAVRELTGRGKKAARLRGDGHRTKVKNRKVRPEIDTLAESEEIKIIASRDTKGENITLEIKALMSICAGTPSGVDLLTKLTDKHFHTDEVKIAYKRLRFLYSRTGAIPDWQTLINDPSVSVASRERLSATIVSHEITPCRSAKQYGGLFRAMNDYSRKRALFEALNRIGATVRRDGMDPETAIMQFKQEALNLVSGFDSNNIHMTGGLVDAGPQNSSLEEVARRVLGHITNLAPTGFHAYDKVNGGFKVGGLILLGADTSKFKSVMMLQHAINQARAGKRVAFYSLEMPEEELYGRLFANLASIDLLKEHREGTKLANVEKNLKKVLAEVDKIWSFWTLVCPAEDVSWDWVAQHAASIEADTVYLDYLGLVSGVTGGASEAAWQALGNVTREAKVYTNTTGRTVVIAAQMRFVDGQPELKYAKVIKDHCIVGDTLIDTGRGIFRIDAMGNTSRKSEMAIITEGNKPSMTSHFHNNGTKPVYKVTLHDGRSIEGTKDHKILVLSSDMSLVWKPLGALVSGDQVALSFNSKFPSSQLRLSVDGDHMATHHNVIHSKLPSQLDAKLAYIVGMLLADGHLSVVNSIVGMVTSDHDVAVKFQSYCDKVFGPYVWQTIAAKTDVGTPIWRVRSARRNVVAFLAQFTGLLGGSAGKFIPDQILASPRRVVAACIQGMMDGDGCNDGHIIHYTSISRPMVERLQLLLNKFNVRCRIYPMTNVTESRKPAWQVRILTNDCDAYLSQIGFTTTRKQQRTLQTSTKTRVRDMPYPHINEYLEGVKLANCKPRGTISTASEIRTLLGVVKDCAVQARHITKKTAKAIMDKDAQLSANLLTIINGGYDFSPVTMVKYAGRKTVYDLTVPVTHNYVANGISSHNCDVMIAWDVLEVEERTFLLNHADKVRGGRRFQYVMEVIPAMSRIIDILPNDKRGQEIATQALEDMKARRDPAKRYLNSSSTPSQSTIDEGGPKRTFGSVKVPGGGFAGGVKSHDVSPDDSPWDEAAARVDENAAKRAQRAARLSGSASGFAAAYEALEAQREAYGKLAKDRRIALEALTKDKTAGLTHEQMAAQGAELLKQYEIERNEATFGFSVLAKDIIKLQASLSGIKSQVDSVKHPELALVLSNERNKMFSKRATPEERAAHRQRIGFVKAAIEKLAQARKAKDKLRIDDLIVTAPKARERDGMNLFEVADPHTLQREWTINAVTYEDRGYSTLPNSAKPKDRRWKLDSSRLKVGSARMQGVAKGDRFRVVDLRWPKVEKLHYLTDAQLEKLVDITNKWQGVPFARVAKSSEYRTDMLVFGKFVSPARERKHKTTNLTEAQYDEIAAKWHLAPRSNGESPNDQTKREIAKNRISVIANDQVKVVVATLKRRNKDRVVQISNAPKVRELRRVGV